MSMISKEPAWGATTFKTLSGALLGPVMGSVLGVVVGATTISPAWAAEPSGAPQMTAAEFDAYVTGKTLTYSQDGAAYGAEEYLPGRRVRWSYLDGRCQEGFWTVDLDLICFIYDNDPTPQCWSFSATPTGLRARFENEPGATELYETQASDEPLYCMGPDVGM